MNTTFNKLHFLRCFSVLMTLPLFAACSGTDAEAGTRTEGGEAEDDSSSEVTAAPAADPSPQILGPGGGRAPGAEPGSCSGVDPLATLRRFAPSDKKVASDYEKYITKEVGTLTCATEGTGRARTITQTIFVPPNAVYDGKGETLTADASAMLCDTSEGEQDEGQRPFFLLAPGASLKNVTFTYPGCEGVHMMGDNVLDNIVWIDAGEDAASTRSYFPGGKITIKNSKGHKASDKMFQFNAPSDVRIENFTGSDMGKLIRQNGGKDFPLRIDLNRVNITGVVSAVVQSDSPQCFVRYHELAYQFKGSGDKADRVFKGVSPANVTRY
jgi:hypothetical protein